LNLESQGDLRLPDHLASQHHPILLVERFEKLARGSWTGFSWACRAHAGNHERTLPRLFADSCSAIRRLSLLPGLRVELRVQSAQTSKRSIDRNRLGVGYSDGVTLRTLLRRKLGRGNGLRSRVT